MPINQPAVYKIFIKESSSCNLTKIILDHYNGEGVQLVNQCSDEKLFLNILGKLILQSELYFWDLSHIELNDQDLKILGPSLKFRTKPFSLKLKLDINNLSETSFENLNFISNNNLKELDLSNNHLGDRLTIILIEKILKNQNLISLNLSKNNISTNLDVWLLPLLEGGYSLADLDLSNNHLGNIGANNIFNKLNYNFKLKNLNLAHNDIYDDGVSNLPLILKYNRSLKNINLSDNHIGDAAVKLIASALKENNSLESLNFINNDFGKYGAEALLGVFEKNYVIKQLDTNVKLSKIKKLFYKLVDNFVKIKDVNINIHDKAINNLNNSNSKLNYIKSKQVQIDDLSQEGVCKIKTPEERKNFIELYFNFRIDKIFLQNNLNSNYAQLKKFFSSNFLFLYCKDIKSNAGDFTKLDSETLSEIGKYLCPLSKSSELEKEDIYVVEQLALTNLDDID